MAANLLTYLGKKSKQFMIALASLLVLVIAVVDYWTGVEWSLSVFYLIPVSLAAWFGNRLSAYWISSLSAVTWFFVDFLKVHAHVSAILPYWNAGVRLGIFIIVTSILLKLKESVDYEFRLAAEIQKGFLPLKIPRLKGVDISGSIRASHAVSGDYYDVLKYGPRKVGLCVADVVGHGVAAALLMSNLQAAFRIYASKKRKPSELCQKLNRTVCNNIGAGKFITFFYGLLDLETKKFVYTNAGHNPPILMRKDGSHLFLDENDLVFGVSSDAAYRETEVEVERGDKLILFTDGVTELENPLGEQYEVTNLLRVLENQRHLNPDKLQNVIYQDLKDFSKGVFPDDITLLVVALGDTMHMAPSQKEVNHHRLDNEGTVRIPDGA